MTHRRHSSGLAGHLNLGVDLAGLLAPDNERVVERANNPLAKHNQLLPRAPALRRLLQLSNLLAALEDPHTGALAGKRRVDDILMGNDARDDAGRRGRRHEQQVQLADIVGLDCVLEGGSDLEGFSLGQDREGRGGSDVADSLGADTVSDHRYT